jgi:hypothetical protein
MFLEGLSFGASCAQKKGVYAMFRRMVYLALAGLILLNLFGCGGGSETKQPDAKEEARMKAAAQAAELSAEVARVKQELADIQNKQADALDSLSRRVLTLSEKAAALESSINTLTAKPAAEDTGAKGKSHWFLTSLLVLTIVVICIILFKRMTREGSEDQDLQDEGFLEENDLGTIRYPGSAKDAEGRAGPKSPQS